MDATDHENIPSPKFGNLYSNLINTGFDYLNQDKPSSIDKTKDSPNVSGTQCNTFSDSKSCTETSRKCKPLGWFYKNLFPEEQICKKACEDKSGFPLSNENKVQNIQQNKHSPHKKYILSNFDLNALSPTSW